MTTLSPSAPPSTRPHARIPRLVQAYLDGAPLSETARRQARYSARRLGVALPAH